MDSLTLIAQDSTTLNIYKKFLYLKSYKIKNEIILATKKEKVSTNLVVIDLINKKGFELLNNIKFEENCFTILITPFLATLAVVPESLKQVNLFFITKPINMKKFEQILENSTNQIQKNAYLKNKGTMLIKAVDDSPLRVAVYSKKGSLVYANTPYIDSNEIEDVNNFHFSDLPNCQLELKDILYNLKIKQLYTIEKQEDKKWYKSFFYLTQSSESLVHLCFDETDNKLYLESLKKSAQFFEKSNEGVIITDKKGRIIATNSSFCHITGYTKDEVIGKSTKILKSGTHNADFYKNMWDTLEHYGKWQGEIWNRRKNGEIYPEWLSITKLVDPETKELNYMAIFTDITSLKEADKKLHFYANYDHLTGLLNKVQFENMLEQSINSAVRNNKKFALLFIDLDYFKDVNDTAGHSAGDLVLKEVASRFQKTIRKEDIIARIGGDEFTVIINDIQEESDALLLANKLNEIIKEPFQIDGKSFYLSLSIGIAIFPLHGLNLNELTKSADSAMYEVKRSGRDGALLYNTSFTKNLTKKILLYTDLKHAVRDEKFEVYYQLVVDIKTKKIIGAEALIRWKHKVHGFVSPEEFIPMAERHGLIEQIGKFVLKTSCEQLPSLLKKFGNNFILAINVSSKEFLSDGFIDNLVETVNDFQIAPKNLELEITETYIMQNHTLATEKMEQLRLAGFNLAIDDFGTGYSSLSYLKKFPINKIKIDKSFVLDILDDQDDQDMVKAIINIAKIFHLEVQAEGVETTEHLAILEQNGVDIAQGYLYAKPDKLENILSKDWNLE